MANINDTHFQHYSMPLHDPYYRPSRVCFTSDLYSIVYRVRNPGVIDDIVPHPLVHTDACVKIVVNCVRELKTGFPEGFSPWNELSIQIPVAYKDQSADYVCGVYSSHTKSIIFDREVYGLPRVPGHVAIEKGDTYLNARLSDLSGNLEMLDFSFVFPRDGSSRPVRSSKLMKIVLKYIPSAALENSPDVKTLNAMKYAKPIVRKCEAGEGEITLLDAAPDYLKQAGMAEVVEARRLDMELDLLGAEVLHNYTKQGG